MLVAIKLCNHHLYLVPRHFHQPEGKPCVHEAVSSHFFLLLGPGNYQPAFCLFWIFHMMGLSLRLRQQRICLKSRRPRFDPWVGKIPWRREWLPTPVFLPWKFHGQRSLVGCSPQGHKESDTHWNHTVCDS